MHNIARVIVLVGMSIFGLRGVLPNLSHVQFLALLALLAVMAIAFCAAVSPGSCPLGELARRKGWLDADSVRLIVSRQRRSGGAFGEIALRENLLSEGQLNELLFIQRSRATKA